jgi:hypothetical protein
MTETMTYPLRLPRSLKRAVERQSKEDRTSITSSSPRQWLKSFPLCKRRIFLLTAKRARISRPLTSS